MALRLVSWSRSCLMPVPLYGPGRSSSVRFVVRAFLAARRRWPGGRLSVRWCGASWVCADGCVGLALRWLPPLSSRVVDYWDSLRCCLSWRWYVDDCAVVGHPPSVWGFVRTFWCALSGRGGMW